MQIITAPQIDGGIRRIATTDADAQAVQRDRAMIDGGIEVLGVLDIDADGTRTWALTGPRQISPDVRAALAQH